MIGNCIPNIRKGTKSLWIVRAVIVVLILLNLGFIWSNSAKVSKESDKTSKKIASEVAPIVVDDYEILSKPEKTKHIRAINGKIRSFAHFAEFVPLGFLLFSLFMCLFDFTDKKTLKKILGYLLWTLIVALLVALSDEIHQLSVKGRTFQKEDILVDTLGSFLGCVAALVPMYMFRKKI